MTFSDFNQKNKSASDLKKELLSNEFSATSLVEQYLQNIKKSNPHLKAFITINEENAINFAKKADGMSNSTREKKPLFGLPIVIPDVLDMRGMPTTFASPLLADRIPTVDATEITCLKDAGAIILGKTNLSEFGLSYTTTNEIVGETVHPLNADYTPGGSNGGAAACVAAGLSPFALATDHRGSVRITASFCGLFALLPTQDSITTIRNYSLPYSEKHFYRKGVIAQNLDDIALLTNVLINKKKIFTDISHVPKSANVAYSSNFGWIPIDTEVKNAFEKTLNILKSAGHQTEKLSFSLDPKVLLSFKNVFAVDRYVTIATLLKEPESYKKLSKSTLRWLEFADKVTGAEYAFAYLYIDWLKKKINSLFDRYEFILTPTSPVPPFRLDSHPIFNIDPDLEIFAFTLLSNISGLPAITFPVGNNDDGMPIGMQLIGKRGSEGELITLAKQITSHKL